MRQQERTILSRDKVITELRLRLPATAGRDEMILKATAEATLAAKEEDYESRKALRVAQSTISSLQVIIYSYAFSKRKKLMICNYVFVQVLSCIDHFI